MPATNDIALMAHLMRRAGFGAPRSELEALVEQGYEETVEQLLDPDQQPELDEYTLYRYLPLAEEQVPLKWLYRMANGHRPLEEKIALFWHQVFATGAGKIENGYEMGVQIDMFRRHGLANYKNLLVELAKSPAMIRWLDNDENHKRAPNENWGRELLELFSLGVGHYTEEDVFECARAFTGWTLAGKIKGLPWGPYPWWFEYRPEDHDGGEKTFLGHTGRFNGEDIIDIILQQPACPQFIARHLYNFFVADEPPVPNWPHEAPQDPEAVEALAEALVDSDYEIRPVLRTLFNSDTFKESTYHRVRGPAEVLAGALRLTGDLSGPDPIWPLLAKTIPTAMGQTLLDPPSVEGWHTGKEWINSGAFMQRVNFAADRVRDTGLPGVKDIVDRAASNGATMTAEELVDRCLDLIGPLEVKDVTRQELVEHAQEGGPISLDTDDRSGFARRVGDVLALIVGTREYQFG